MKVMCILLLAALPLSSFAQSEQPEEPPRNQIDIGVGAASIYQIADVFSDVLVTTLSGGTYTVRSSEYSPVFYGQYAWAVNNHVQVLGDVNYAYIRKQYEDENGQDAGKVNSRIYGLLAGANVYWFGQHRHVVMYSGLQAGISILRSETTVPESTVDNMVAFNMQFTGIGLRLGDPIGIHVETGFGCKGLINAGLTFKFR